MNNLGSRLMWSLWSEAGIGFGIGLWRVKYRGYNLWTLCLGPLSLYWVQSVGREKKVNPCSDCQSTYPCGETCLGDKP